MLAVRATVRTTLYACVWRLLNNCQVQDEGFASAVFANAQGELSKHPEMCTWTSGAADASFHPLVVIAPVYLSVSPVQLLPAS